MIYRYKMLMIDKYYFKDKIKWQQIIQITYALTQKYIIAFPFISFPKCINLKLFNIKNTAFPYYCIFQQFLILLCSILSN